MVTNTLQFMKAFLLNFAQKCSIITILFHENNSYTLLQNLKYISIVWKRKLYRREVVKERLVMLISTYCY